MKKMVIAFVAGAIVMFSSQAVADTISQIGRKVDSETSVYVNGEKVSDAIIIKGKSYVPGRDIAESLGAKVEWKGSEGILITNNPSTEEAISEHNNKVKDYNAKKAELAGKIYESEITIEQLSDFIEKYNDEYLKGFGEPYRKYYAEEVGKYKIQLEEEKTRLAQYEEELLALESAK